MEVAIIGCGRVARSVHVPAFLCIRPDVHLRLFDVRTDLAAELLSETPGAAAVSSLDEALDGADLATICTPNATHADYVRICGERGVPCLCEKPVSHTPDAIDRLLTLQARTQSATFVNLPYVASRVFGAVQALFATRAPIRVELQFSTLGLRFWRPLTDWYDKPLESGGGALLDLGAHAIHFLEQASQRDLDVEACTAPSAPREDGASLQGRLGDAAARLNIDRRAKRPAFLLRLWGRDGVEWACDVLTGELRADGEVVESCGAFDSHAAVKLFAAGRPLERFSLATALSAERKVYAAYSTVQAEHRA
jgi:predicted dehydrogenase